MKTPRSIVITGASGGIGRALAERYAAPGAVLALTGRDEARLAETSAVCEKRGARVIRGVLDVTDRSRMAAWLAEVDAAHPVDLVIANAGISAGTGGVLHGEDPAQARRIFDVNLTGVLNTIEPLIPRMIERGSGQIALMGSLAGFRGWPGAPAYCASKAAVKVYGESLRGALEKAGLAVSVICPGFVESRMTAVNEFPMPFLMSAEKAADIIARGLDKNRGRIAFPLPAYILAGIMGCLPDSLAQRILKAAPAKRS